MFQKERTEQLFPSYPFQHHFYGIETHHVSVSDLAHHYRDIDVEYIFKKEYESIKIGDVKLLRDLVFERTEKEKIFIISFFLIEREAQNAFLKILEEPSANTIFFFIFPYRNSLLPTLQSRMEIYSFLKREDQKGGTDLSFGDFLKMGLSDRFQFIQKFVKKDKDALKKSEVLIFLNEAEQFILREEKIRERFNLLKEVLTLKGYLYQRGASVKMILDYLATILPLVEE